jgi:N6-L-threonylcarbamoyladenine synthase
LAHLRKFFGQLFVILGIESSCDETGVALVSRQGTLISHALYSQVAMHADYGGVVPELASRDHIKRWIALTESVCNQASVRLHEIDGIAYTQGPGLAGALLVGAAGAAALGFALNKPIVGVHHLEGHLLSPLLAPEKPAFPFVALLVSGGHTQLMAVKAVGDYKLLGETLDDAAGEAFDKSAKLLGLGYPGGPALSAAARDGDPKSHAFPRPMLKELKRSGDLNFSFSGLKTAVSLAVKRANAENTGNTCGAKEAISEQSLSKITVDLAASTEAAIVDVLVAKAIAACARAKLKTLVVAGGVGANRVLRAQLTHEAAARGITVFYPPLELCTDNGAMIALAGSFRLATEGVCDYRFNVKPRWPLGALQAVATSSFVGVP